MKNIPNSKFFLAFLFIFLEISNVKSKLPVIAILANADPDDASSAIRSRVNMQYVRWLEQSRADVVVIQPWYNETQIDEVLSKVNGVLWQGGSRNLDINGQYESVARMILLKIIEKFENENVSIPLWGTCQGFELIHVLLVNSVDILSSFNSHNYQAPLIIFEEIIRNSKMFSELDEKDKNNIKTKNVTSQYHHLGVNPESYLKHKILHKMLKITSIAKDKDENYYIASIEGKKYPIYAVQFHPEMVQFTKIDKKGVADSPEAVKFSEQISNFLISEAKKNTNTMTPEDYKKYDYINSFEKLPVYDDGYYYYFFNKEEEK